MEEKKTYRHYKKKKYGEDHDLNSEKKRENSYHNDNICDTHIDGA